jgi:hypothetical protein
VKLVAERPSGAVVTETELACIERDEQISVADLGLRLDEAKQLTAALQAAIVPAQMAALSACRQACGACGRQLAARGHYEATFRSLFGDVPVRVRRWFVCLCQGASETKSVAALDLGGDGVAPELAYVTARYAALVPFGKAAALLSELLPISGAQHASTVRNRTLRVGKEIVQAQTAEITNPPTPPASDPVVVGLDGGYVRNRHRAEGRRFEVIAGKVIHADGAQHRFAFTRTGPAATGRGVPPGARCGGCQRGDTRDGAVRWRRRSVAAAARGAGGGRYGVGLVACRGALRAHLAGGPRPWREYGRNVLWCDSRAWSGAGEVALVARTLARVSAPARRFMPLDAAQTHAGCGRRGQSAPAHR